MGGIAGIIDFNQNMLTAAGKLNTMLQNLKHRGQDGLGIHATANACLGSTSQCLSDPYGGSQPMTRSIGQHTYAIVFNGEIFNAAELRQELIQKGYAFFTHSDTEVLLTAYIEWGPSCPDHLNGMFAFAVWEQHSQRLFMARDRMGVKPLYYTIAKNSILFASEIKALLCSECVSPILTEEGIMELFALAPGRTPGKTPYKNIDELKPGECMVFSRLGVYIHRYWQYQCRIHTENAEDTAEHLKCLIQDAIKKQMQASVPVCTFLSGGLDSSIISTIVSQSLLQKNDHLNSYSIHFPQDEKYFHEDMYQPNADSDYIKIITEYLKCDHTVFTADIDKMTEALKDAAIARDMPGMADVDSSFLLLCREMAKNFSVALSGECADEVFGGYPWFYSNDLLYSESFPWAQSSGLRQKLLHKGFVHLPILAYTHDRYMETASEAPILKEEPKEAQLRRQKLYVNAKWFMTNLLERQDRMGMACGLEIRAPFCDNNIVEYAWNIPWDMINFGGMEKGILRLAMKQRLPEQILSRKKSPYPKTHHPEYMQKVSSLLTDIIEDKNARLLELVDKETILSLIKNPEQIVTPWYGQLMTAPQLFAFLIQLDFWLSAYKIKIEA